MSVILLVAADPFSWFLPFFDVLGRELGASFGGGFGNFFGEIFRGIGLLGGSAIPEPLGPDVIPVPAW